MPLPLRARNLKGYELLTEEDMSHDQAPKELMEAKKLSIDEEETKDKLWERRLLDLSMKNALLNFIPTKAVVQLLSSSADDTLDVLTEKGEMTLAPATAEVKALAERKTYFGALISAEATSATAEIITAVKKAFTFLCTNIMFSLCYFLIV
jgi:hypothetical protein